MARLQTLPTVTSSGRPGAAAAKVWKARLRVSISTSGRTRSCPDRYSSVARSGSIEISEQARRELGLALHPDVPGAEEARDAVLAGDLGHEHPPARLRLGQAEGRRDRALAGPALAEHEPQPPLPERRSGNAVVNALRRQSREAP